MGGFCQSINILCSFVTRSLFIKYIGVELLGLSSTFSSILGMLSLAELGFQPAVVYSLYKPLYYDAREEINKIMNILKLVYRSIGIFLIIATLIVTPFLKYIINGIEVNIMVYMYFWLQSLTSICSYFLAYKRAILYADRKDYVTKIIDLITSVIFSIFQCIVMIYFTSYGRYLALKIAQTYFANIAIHIFCAKRYPYLRKGKIDTDRLREIWVNVKNIFASKIAGYIYNSTDNLVISLFISTASVGYLVNYTTITTSLKKLTGEVFSPIIPVLGNYLVGDKSKENRENVFLKYTFVRYMIALLIVLPTVILIDDFITVWVGCDMILDKVVVILLGIDLYIHLVHSATCDFISSAGLFKSDKYVEVVGAVCNIVSTIIFVQFMGIAGALVGTVISQMILWIGRSIIVYRECFNIGIKGYLYYWMINGLYIVIAVALGILLNAIVVAIPVRNTILKFAVGGIISEVFIFLVCLVIFGRKRKIRDWIIS